MRRLAARRLAWWAAGCLAATALCLPSASAMSLREMRTIEQLDARGETYVQYYLIGVMEGALEADRMARRQGRKPLYCPPKPPAPAMAASLFHAELRRNEGVYEADMPVELVMTQAQVTSLFWVVTFIIPGLIAIVGAGVWLQRRS